MKDREISGKPRSYFECISLAILFGLFSHGFVNSSQASQFAKRNFKYKQNGEGREIANFLGFPIFHAKPQQRNGKDVMICNDINCARDRTQVCCHIFPA